MDKTEQGKETMRLLRRMFTEDGAAGYTAADGAAVICPFCPPAENASCIHFDTAELDGHDNYDASGFPGLDVRGDVTVIAFWSETCPHRWGLGFGFHKGATFVTVQRLPDRK